MSDPIDMICALTDCTPDTARIIYEETKDVTIAVDKILFKTELPRKKKRVLNEVESEIEKIRETMKELDKQLDARPDSTINQFPATLLSQRVREESVSRPVRRGETVLQNNYSQEYQLPVLQSEAQIQGTVCPSQSESICDSPSRDQT